MLASGPNLIRDMWLIASGNTPVWFFRMDYVHPKAWLIFVFVISVVDCSILSLKITSQVLKYYTLTILIVKYVAKSKVCMFLGKYFWENYIHSLKGHGPTFKKLFNYSLEKLSIKTFLHWRNTYNSDLNWNFSVLV